MKPMQASNVEVLVGRPPTLKELREAESRNHLIVNVAMAPADWTAFMLYDEQARRGFYAGYMTAASLPQSAWMILLLCPVGEDPHKLAASFASDISAAAGKPVDCKIEAEGLWAADRKVPTV